MNISDNNVAFKEIERLAQRIAFETARTIIAAVLKDWDKHLMQCRDKAMYINRGLKTTAVKTTVGEVPFSRTLYDIIDGGVKRGHVFLLDEAMGISGSGQFSELLKDLIVQACCDGAYRSAARSVSEMTGQTISHTAAWNVVQAIGGRLDNHEQHAAALAEGNEGAGTIEPPVLFEEQDGISLCLQGKDRKEHGGSKEMKLAIAYDGAEKKGKERYILTNKVACASFGGVDEFVKRKEGVIAEAYNVDEIAMRFLNGDGASWIKRSKTDENVHMQLSQFHRNRAVMRQVSNHDARGVITEIMCSKDIDLLLHVIEVEALSVEDEEERKKLSELLRYFENNKDCLVPCHRRGLDIPKPPEGKVYRRMGAMESNIFTIIGNRMKGRRANWSIKGGGNLARLLCLKHTGKLIGTLKSLSACILPERYFEEITVEYSAAKVPHHEGKGYNGFRQVFVPSSHKWLKDIAKIKPLYA